MPDRFNLSDVMISYSRRDKAFVQQLEQALRQENLEIWIDWEDIPPTADWWQEVQAGIEAAHTFVFIISPASVNSTVCRREIDHALLHHKRLIPVLRQELSADDQAKMHPALSTHNWVYFRASDHFRRAFLTLRAALESDLNHKKLHTRLLVRAREWEERKKSRSLLLRGDELREAESWLLTRKTPAPTERQIEYIRTSRRVAGRQQQASAGLMIGMLLILGLLATTAFADSRRASNQAQTAVYEISARGTQEKIVIDSLSAASTAQALEQAGGADAQTAQARMALAETQAALALTESGNSQTRAYVARQNALTATVLQGEAEALAQSAQAEQTQSGAAAAQAQAQILAAQQEARQANTQAALLSTQAAQTAAPAFTLVAEVQIIGTQSEIALQLNQTHSAQLLSEAESMLAQAARQPTDVYEQLQSANQAATAAALAVAVLETDLFQDRSDFNRLKLDGPRTAAALVRDINRTSTQAVPELLSTARASSLETAIDQLNQNLWNDFKNLCRAALSDSLAKGNPSARIRLICYPILTPTATFRPTSNATASLTPEAPPTATWTATSSPMETTTEFTPSLTPTPTVTEVIPTETPTALLTISETPAPVPLPTDSELPIITPPEVSAG